MVEDEYIGTCNQCGKLNMPICPDTGWCDECALEYAEEQRLQDGETCPL